MIGDSRFHGRGDADRTVDSAEIVVRKVQAQRAPVVLPFLTETRPTLGILKKTAAPIQVFALAGWGAPLGQLLGLSPSG